MLFYLAILGANINRTDNDGMTALTWACKMSKRQSATCLLEKGADVDTTDKQGRLPLDYAAVSGDPNIVQVCKKKKKRR